MKTHLVLCLFLAAQLAALGTAFGANDTTVQRGERSFDSDWRFLRGDAPGADAPGFDDSAWRIVDVPHDWSIEDLPSKEGAPPSPFDPERSAGGAATGYTVGGIGWYRKHFTLSPSDRGKNVSVCFDGVYANADVWLNGHHLGGHPYGYTPFVFDLTPHLKPAGEANVLAVQVKNVGQSSRWYSGSGIYRHVQLAIADPVHIPFFGVHVMTPEVSRARATVRVATTIENSRNAGASVRLRTLLIGPDGKATSPHETEVRVSAGKREEFTQEFSVNDPALWSLDTPALYRAEVELVSDDGVLDRSAATFGIRTIKFTAEKGFELNGEVVELKGGNLHHDNGPLGSAAIDRAEERRGQLMKAYGFNAIRTAHNPPSPAFLDACDRLGVLVMDEAFDMWEKPKNPDDYHLHFKDWWQRDLEAMIRRDRNHPSVILWSIGNEIPERADPSGVALAREMVSVIRPLDATRPITAGICIYWDQPERPWSDVAPAFESLDVAGYNYQWERYAADHETSPSRIMVGSETIPSAVFDAWQAVLKQPWVIGDFVWTAWDHLGETGTGGTVLDNEPGPREFPWFNTFCGDVDLCGFKKAPLYYREVVWGESQVNLAVHAPIPPGRQEKVAYWGWPDERQSWTWHGSEGESLDVTVYSNCASVRLELNSEEIATQATDPKMIARFKVPYRPGELRAVGLSADGQPVAHAVLRTAGKPKAIRLAPDRSTLRASRDDLSYVTVEIVDEHGAVVPNADILVRFAVAGAGELAAVGSGAPNDASSFRLPIRKTWQGRCLAILRPKGDSGAITLNATADGLEAATAVVEAQ